MNKNMVRLSFSVIVVLLVASCSPVSRLLVTPSAAFTPPVAAIPELASAAPPTLTPSPSDTPLPTPSPTDPPTPTPSQPVFNLDALGDNRVLASFIVTRKVKNTNNGELSEKKDTIGYIKEPLSAYELIESSYVGGAGKDKTYLIGGWFYHENSSGDLYLFLEANQPDQSNIDNLQSGADMRRGNVAQVKSAQFVGQEDFQGIPANHFTFDQTDLEGYDYYTETNPAPKAEGDFYLTQDGNYVLYTHFKEARPFGAYEVTEELSSINQLTEITLPTGFLPLNLELDLVLPLPAGTTLAGIVRYANGLGVDYYSYVTSVRNNDEFLEFYKNLVSTDGWRVSHIGEVINHNICGSQDCVIINKGDAQIILYYNKGRGTIGADWDKQHVFHPK